MIARLVWSQPGSDAALAVPRKSFTFRTVSVIFALTSYSYIKKLTYNVTPQDRQDSRQNISSPRIFADDSHICVVIIGFISCRERKNIRVLLFYARYVPFFPYQCEGIGGVFEGTTNVVYVKSRDRKD